MGVGVIGGEVGANTVTVEEAINSGDDNSGVINPNIEDGGGVRADEGDGLGGNFGASGGIEGVMDDSVGGGDGFGGDENVGGDGNGDSGSPVEPIPLIPRWRLREILAHAEGECILNMVEVLLLCVYRAREMLRVLGLVLPIGKQCTWHIGACG